MFMPQYDGSEGEAIAIDEAAALTANFRRNNGNRAETVKAHLFGRDILRQILDQENCVGIRMYHGLDDTGGKQLVLIGVDADGQDMEASIVADKSRVCPPDCSTSTLNG